MWCGEYQYRSYTSAYIGRDSLLPTREDTGGARVVLELTPPQVNGKERDGGEGAKVSLVRHPHWRLSAQAYVGYWWLHSSRHFVIKASGLASFWTRVAAIVPTWYICMVVVREVGVRKRASKPKHEQMNHHSSTRTIQPEPARKKSLQSCQQFTICMLWNTRFQKSCYSRVTVPRGCLVAAVKIIVLPQENNVAAALIEQLYIHARVCIQRWNWRWVPKPSHSCKLKYKHRYHD